MISFRIQRLAISAVLAAAVLAVYAPAAHYDFIALDDAQYVRDNHHINHGFSRAGIQWVFENVVSGNWHPVTMLSHMADCEIYGLSPGGQHFTNVLLHTANTVLLFWLLLAMMDRRKPAGTATVETARRKVVTLKPEAPSSTFNLWPCALTAAFFGLHPLHVESVAWISERKDVLSGFFGLLTLWCYQEYAANSGSGGKTTRVFYILAWLMFSLGLMSKSMLVTLPLVMLLLDFWPLQRFRHAETGATNLRPVKASQRLLIEKIPFLVLAAIFCVITFQVQKSAGAVVTLQHFPLSARLANAMVSYAHYLDKTFWPGSLAMLYPYQQWSTAQTAGSTILFVGLSLVAIWAAPRKPYIFVGWFWFAGMLVPVIGLVQVGLQAMADHYMYLPSIGVFMALAWGLADFAVTCASKTQKEKEFRLQKSGQPVGPKTAWPVTVAIPAFTLIVAACLGVASAVQVRYWQNSETLFGHAVRVTGQNTVAHYILGALDDSQGQTDLAANEFAEAVADDPGNVKALCGLGYIFCEEGKWDEATKEYESALQLAPDFAKAHFGLAEVLMKEHHFSQAMSEYSLALQSDPDIPEAHYQLAGLDNAKGDAISALAQLEEAVRLAPNWPLALNNLAWMRATEQDSKLRDGAEASRLAMRAVVLTRKNDPSTLDTLAAAYAETGQFTDAATTATMAIQIANAADETNLTKQIQSRLKLYQSQQSYRE
jgi:tetratricopeptide (TPR) repeat protein